MLGGEPGIFCSLLQLAWESKARSTLPQEYEHETAIHAATAAYTISYSLCPTNGSLDQFSIISLVVGKIWNNYEFWAESWTATPWLTRKVSPTRLPMVQPRPHAPSRCLAWISCWKVAACRRSSISAVLISPVQFCENWAGMCGSRIPMGPKKMIILIFSLLKPPILGSKQFHTISSNAEGSWKTMPVNSG